MNQFVELAELFKGSGSSTKSMTSSCNDHTMVPTPLLGETPLLIDWLDTQIANCVLHGWLQHGWRVTGDHSQVHLFNGSSFHLYLPFNLTHSPCVEVIRRLATSSLAMGAKTRQRECFHLFVPRVRTYYSLCPVERMVRWNSVQHVKFLF